MKYSIIVPVYNVSFAIERCIKSIQKQTISDFELLLVDDGSTDQSGMICDRYATQDMRIHVIHKENGGVSSARNVGLNAASGTYIVFLDSDDYVDASYLERFETQSAELLIAGYQIEGAGIDKTILHQEMPKQYKKLTKEEKIKLFQAGKLNYVCTKRFCADIIQQHKIRFDETLTLAEDTLFVVEYMRYCQSLVLMPDMGYHYVRYEHETLATGKLSSKLTIDRIEASNEKIYRVLKNYESKEVYDVMQDRMGHIYHDVLMDVVQDPKCTYAFCKMLFRKKWFRETLKHVDTVYADESPKYRMILKCGSPQLFWLFLTIKHLKEREDKNE